MKNFKKLRIWQMGMEIAKVAYAFVNSFPMAETFGLSRQITKAAVSIPSNIAEGSSRNSSRDQIRFLQISLGSSFELETQLLISKELSYGNDILREQLLFNIVEVQKMLTGFINKISQVKD